MLQVILDDKVFQVAVGTSVAAALAQAGDGSCRTSVSDQRRAPLCGMGICQECRVLVDGQRRLACQTLCRDGMQVESRA
jgi:succinate dehydrogenase/fumarate reductase-like Fe-S protein